MEDLFRQREGTGAQLKQIAPEVRKAGTKLPKEVLGERWHGAKEVGLLSY